jgi:hypothetical protein
MVAILNMTAYKGIEFKLFHSEFLLFQTVPWLPILRANAYGHLAGASGRLKLLHKLNLIFIIS